MVINVPDISKDMYSQFGQSSCVYGKYGIFNTKVA